MYIVHYCEKIHSFGGGLLVISLLTAWVYIFNCYVLKRKFKSKKLVCIFFSCILSYTVIISPLFLYLHIEFTLVSVQLSNLESLIEKREKLSMGGSIFKSEPPLDVETKNLKKRKYSGLGNYHYPTVSRYEPARGSVYS